MNEQLFIQWLKRLPRVGQGLSEEQNKLAQNRAEGSAGEQTGIGGTTISIVGLTAAAKGIDVLTSKFNETAAAASGLLQPIEQFNKALGTSTKLSAQILTPSHDQSKLLKDQNISQQSILQNAINFSKLLPGQARNIQKSNSEFGTLNALITAMTEKQAVSNDAALNFGRFLAASGEDSQTLLRNLQMSAKAIEFSTGETGVFRDQINAVGSLSAATRQEFRGTAEELAAAALQATRLGTTLEESRTSSEKFLNIQGSIESELISMQMTGINQAKEMNQLRMAAQMGDYDQIAQIQSKLISENFEQVKKKGRIAMKAYADGIGLTVEEMSKMYETSKGVNALQQENTDLTLEQYKTKRGISTEEEKILKRFKEKVKAETSFDTETLTMGEIGQNQKLMDLYKLASDEVMDDSGIPTDDTRTAYERAEAITSTAKEGVAARLGEDSEKLISGVEAGANELATNIRGMIDAAAGIEDLSSLTEFAENIGKTFLSSLAQTILGDRYIVNVAKAVKIGFEDAQGITPKTTPLNNNKNSRNTGTVMTD
jgi:hypothetical protein